MRKTQGQLGSLQGIILTIVVIGVLLGAGFFILDEFLDQTDDNVFTVTNESGGWINQTTYLLAQRNIAPGFHSPVVTSAINSTSNASIPVGNMTVDGQGRIINSTSLEYEAVSFTYTYKGGTTAFIGMNDTINALLTIPELLGLVVLIAMVGVILFLVFNMIPGARVSGA